MKTSIIIFLACLPFTSRAGSTYVGDRIFVAPFSSESAASLIGNVTLPNAGAYAAADWFIVGNIQFGSGGDYTLTSTSGSIHITGQLLGPPSGHVTLRVQHRGHFSVIGTVAPDITIVDAALSVWPDYPPTTAAAVPLTNLSSRATLRDGQVLNFGFVIGGNVARRVLIRSVGPGLAPYGVSNAMQNPMLTVYSGSLAIASNDDWKGADDLNAVFSKVGAFSLRPESGDAAISLTLSPGAYTVVARGASADDSGEVLAEVYFIE